MSDLSRWCLVHYEALHDFAAPVATFCAACGAVFVTWWLGSRQADIARQQTQLATVRLKHDLFDRRITTFIAIQDLIMEVLRTGNVSDDAWNEFVRGVETAEFLFGQEIADYIADIRNRASKFKLAADMLADRAALPVGPERTTFAQVRSDQFTWLVEQSNLMTAKFKPALSIAYLQPRVKQIRPEAPAAIWNQAVSV